MSASPAEVFSADGAVPVLNALEDELKQHIPGPHHLVWLAFVQLFCGCFKAYATSYFHKLLDKCELCTNGLPSPVEKKSK